VHNVRTARRRRYAVCFLDHAGTPGLPVSVYDCIDPPPAPVTPTPPTPIPVPPAPPDP